MLHFDETDTAVTSDGASVVICVLDGHGGDHGRIASQVRDAAEIVRDAAEIVRDADEITSARAAGCPRRDAEVLGDYFV